MANSTNDDPQASSSSPEEDITKAKDEVDINELGSEEDKVKAESDRPAKLSSLPESKIVEEEKIISKNVDITEAQANNPAPVMDSPPEPTPINIAPETKVEAVNTKTEQSVNVAELKEMIKSLKGSQQESLKTSQVISAKVDTVATDTEVIIKQVNNLSTNYVLLSSEMESLASGSTSKSMLSKSFLIITSLILVILVAIQIYMFTVLNKVQLLQNTEGSKVLLNISSLNKKMGDYDKNLTKALEKPVQQEHAQASATPTGTIEQNTHGNINVGTQNPTPVVERLNKIRNGTPEKKLIRKETGDWFILNNKNTDCISDAEVIQALNEAYNKLGRTMPKGISLPPNNNAICLLRPDGKGGTQIVMTKEFLK